MRDSQSETAPTWQVKNLLRKDAMAGWSVLLAVLFTFVGSQSDEAGPLFVLFGFWTLHITLGIVITVFVTSLLMRVGLLNFRPWLQLAISGLVGALIFTPLGIGIELFFETYAGLTDDDGAQSSTSWASAYLNEFISLAPPFVASWFAMNFTYVWWRSSITQSLALDQQPTPMAPTAEATPKEPTTVVAPKTSGLINKLPPALGSEILLLKSDLNYLHVRTTKGRSMVLYSLTQATNELGERGLRAHRSYWVAKHAVKRVMKRDRQLMLELTNGDKVPVSRRRQSDIIAEFGASFSRSDPAPSPE